MDSIYRGDIASKAGRRNAWVDALFVDHALLRLVWTNFATVVPGRLYRSNHPTPAKLALAARRHGIRTIVNLRGATWSGADALSRAAAARLGLGMVDVPMRSSRAPTRDEVLALIAAFETAPPPILVHCKSGADRAGFAAGIYLLMHGAGSAEALRQLSRRHGHLRRSRTGILDAFFDAYALAEGRLGLAAWVRTEYEPSSLRPTSRESGIARLVQDHVLRRE